MLNGIGRNIPDSLLQSGNLKVYGAGHGNVAGLAAAGRTASGDQSSRHKLLGDVRSAIAATQLRDGATISFHHHLRNGDRVLNLVLDECARAGLQDLTLAASSIFPVHAPLIAHIRSGVVSKLVTSYVSGPVAHAISRDRLLNVPLLMQTHGGRARAIQSGELAIDVAFIAAPAADDFGNITGTIGRNACGPLGYAMVDARFAKTVVALTDSLHPYPLCPSDIKQDLVDFVVVVDSIGDSEGIVSGTTRMTSEASGLRIAATAAEIIAASGLLADGFSFQTGAGGISLAVAAEVRKLMTERRTQGSFAAGGITGYLVEMLEAGLFRALWDVQSFDLRAVESFRRNPNHQAMSASLYANPSERGAVVDRLDAVILGAAEVDREFNTNVTTSTEGLIIGGSGGHSDTAAGAKLTIITTRLNAGGFPKIVDRVTTVTTPGETVDVVVTDVGVAVNPRRAELVQRLLEAGQKVTQIEDLAAVAARQATRKGVGTVLDDVVGLVEYRTGEIIDVVRAVASEQL